LAVFLAQVGLLLIVSAGPAAAQVTKVDTHVVLTSLVNPSVFGQSVGFFATAVPADPLAGTLTGTMQFSVDGADLGGPIVLNGGQAAVSTLTLSVGTHTVAAVYSGDAAFNGSTGSLAGGQAVNKANSRVLLSSFINPSVFGQQVTFTAVVRPIAPGSGSPQGGTVQFRVDGADFGSPVAVSGGQATKSTTALAVGSHGVTAFFSGDAGFNGSTGTLAAAQVVNNASTTTSVTSSVNPSVFGQRVTFTATLAPVAPGSGSPGGSVQFSVGGVSLGGPILLSAGTASISTNAVAVGTHAVTASYGGGANFNGSTGALAGGQTVNRPDSVTSLSSSDNPSKRGQSVTFTAVVSPNPPGSGSPTGSVTFTIDGNGAVTVDIANRQASFSTAALSTGDHTVMAAYSGEAGFNASSAVLTQTVISPDTTTALTSSTNPSVFGQQVTFTATVASDDPGAGTPGGRVQFAIDGDPFGQPVDLSGGQATVSIDTLEVGDHSVTAAYSGDGTFNKSSGSLTQTVDRADTTTHVASDHNPSVFGQPVTLTATVNVDAPGAGNPGGTVQFTIDGKDFGQPVDLSGGQATISTDGLDVGDHGVKAIYSGSGSFNGSFDTLSQSVNRADTSTRLTSNHNPSVFGQQVTFTASVTVGSPGAGTPGGTVQFTIDGDARQPVSLSEGQASITLSGLPVGNHSVRAVYSGNGGFTGSGDSLTQTVNRADTSTQVVSSANPSVVGSSVTFTAHVTVNAPGAGTPTGTIQFQMDGSDLGPRVGLSGGSVSMTASALPPGTLTISAIYAGDGSFAGSSDWLSQSIQYATGDCQGTAGRQILPPINAGDPVSEVNAGSTVPVKFRVCDANGDTVGTPGVVESVELVKRVGDESGEEVLHQAWTDGEFKYSNHAWKLNLETKSLDSGFTYFWSVHLDDETSIDFRFHLKGGSSASPGTTKKH
jgi:hypothetical protein